MARTTMSRNAAKTYIARIIGGAGDAGVLDMAEEALQKGYSEWQTARNWEGLLKDDTLGFTVAGLTTISDTLAPTVAGDFDGVNIGVTVTLSVVSGTPALTTGTTVKNYLRNSTGGVATIILTNAITGSGTYSLTFTGDIPIIQGIQDYNLPPDFFRAYTARLISNKQWPVDFVRPRYWNKRTINDQVQGVVEAYTIFNSISSNTQGNGTKRLRVYRIPASADILRLTYYRMFNVLADPIDMEDDFLYKFLDFCSAILLDRKRAQDNPSGYMAEVMSNMQAAMVADEETTEDEDIRLISQMEMGDTQKPLWTNGQFNSDYGY